MADYFFSLGFIMRKYSSESFAYVFSNFDEDNQ